MSLDDDKVTIFNVPYITVINIKKSLNLTVEKPGNSDGILIKTPKFTRTENNNEKSKSYDRWQ